MDALRKRTHDLSNQVMVANIEMIELSTKTAHLISSFEKLEESVERQSKVLQRLEYQAQVLKWLLGVATVVLCGLILREISG